MGYKFQVLSLASLEGRDFRLSVDGIFGLLPSHQPVEEECGGARQQEQRPTAVQGGGPAPRLLIQLSFTQQNATYEHKYTFSTYSLANLELFEYLII